jgi:HK97 family phage major capsid protein
VATFPRNTRHPPEGPRTISVRRDTPEPSRTFGAFLKYVREAYYARLPADRYMASQVLEKDFGSGYEYAGGYVEKTALGEGSGQTGGYLIPQDLTLELMRVVSEESFIYPRALVIPMTTLQVLAPTVDVTTVQSAGTSPFFGGLLFKWGSSQAPAETEPAFRQLQLTAWDLLGYCTVSNQWLWDVGPGGEDYLLQMFGRAAAWYAEYAFLQGTGTVNQMPLGILKAPGTVSLTRQTSNQITQVDVAGMAAQLIPYSWNNAVWACSPSALAQLFKITGIQMNMDALGQPGLAGYLLSRPLYVTDKLPPLGTKGDLVLFDPSLYVVGVRQEVLVDVSPQVAFKTNQTDFRVWLRLDGKPQVNSGVTLADGSTVAGAYVALN